jgi:ribosomal protein S18 acetylase RimI-like enzyme
MSAGVHTLADGEPLTIRIVEPPLGDLADRVEYWWRDIREPLLAGELADTSLDRFVLGELRGEVVGSLTYATPRDTRDVAVLEMVWTRPDRRRQGVAGALLDQALADFRAGGGMAMHLCTTNPHAFALYTQAGFRPLIGDGMRYLAPSHEDFDRAYFADAGPARVRPAVWGDLARVAMLYNQPQPDWLVKDYSRRVFRDMRYEGQYRQVWLPTRAGRGSALVLENPRRRVVGLASLTEVDSYYEQHVRTLECWACAAYLPQLPQLVCALLDEAEAGAVERVEAAVAAIDVERQQVLRACGLRQATRLRGRLRVGERRVDLLIYARRLGRPRPASRPLAAYYGATPAFQPIRPPLA